MSDATRHKKGEPRPSRGSKPGERRGNAGKGRPKGTPNRATAHAREAIGAFVEANVDRMQHLLDRIEAEDGPKAAFSCITDVLEFHVPKLARTELTGAGGGPVVVSTTPTDESL